MCGQRKLRDDNCGLGPNVLWKIKKIKEKSQQTLKILKLYSQCLWHNFDVIENRHESLCDGLWFNPKMISVLFVKLHVFCILLHDIGLKRGRKIPEEQSHS